MVRSIKPQAGGRASGCPSSGDTVVQPVSRLETITLVAVDLLYVFLVARIDADFIVVVVDADIRPLRNPIFVTPGTRACTRPEHATQTLCQARRVSSASACSSCRLEHVAPRWCTLPRRHQAYTRCAILGLEPFFLSASHRTTAATMQLITAVTPCCCRLVHRDAYNNKEDDRFFVFDQQTEGHCDYLLRHVAIERVKRGPIMHEEKQLKAMTEKAILSCSLSMRTRR